LALFCLSWIPWKRMKEEPYEKARIKVSCFCYDLEFDCSTIIWIASFSGSQLYELSCWSVFSYHIKLPATDLDANLQQGKTPMLCHPPCVWLPARIPAGHLPWGAHVHWKLAADTFRIHSAESRHCGFRDEWGTAPAVKMLTLLWVVLEAVLWSRSWNKVIPDFDGEQWWREDGPDKQRRVREDSWRCVVWILKYE
jgi:hypothetical protein